MKNDKNILTFNISKPIMQSNGTAGSFNFIKNGRMSMNRSKMIVFTKYLLNFMFYSGIVVTLSLPWTIRLAGTYSSDIKDHYLLMLVVLFLSGICALIILWQLKKMVRTVAERNCFVDENTKSLKSMGKVAFIICILFLIKVVIFPTPAAFIIILTFFVAGIFSHVLGLVFAEAVRYKEENDLTI